MSLNIVGFLENIAALQPSKLQYLKFNGKIVKWNWQKLDNLLFIICLRVRGSLVYRNGEPLVDDENNFPEGSEVTFNCIENIMGEKTTWKIVCEDGSWIGRSLNCGKIIRLMFKCNLIKIFHCRG